MTIFRKYRRKLFWPAGLIILALVPLGFFRYIATDPRFHQKYVMEIILPPFGDDFKWIKDREPEFDIPQKGMWTKYEFSEDESYNSLLLVLLRQEIRRFMIRRDTIQGIQISLNRQMPYDRFVRIIDMLDLENVTRFTIFGSSVWVHKFYRHPITEPDYSHLFICGGVHTVSMPESAWTQRINQRYIEYRNYLSEAIISLPYSVISIWLLIFAFNIFRINRYSSLPNPRLPDQNSGFRPDDNARRDSTSSLTP